MKVSSKTSNRLKSQYGDWALITGATSGIGRELAQKLGEARFNLVIAGRNEGVLNQLSYDMQTTFRVQAIVVSGELSEETAIKTLLDKTQNLPIGIVILNAGYGTSGSFLDADLETELNMLDLNCKAVCALAHSFGNRMRAQSRKGAIVLLSSMVAFQGVPFAANYAASKAYVQSLGEELARECKTDGIDVLCAAPGPVESGFSARANMKMNMGLKPEDVGVPIINAIGKRSTVLPGMLTKILVYSLRTAPRWAKIRIMGSIMSGFTKHQQPEKR